MMRLRTSLCLVGLVVAFSASTVLAQDPKWERLVTPPTGIVSVSSSARGSIFVETMSNGAYRSTDYGDTWKKILPHDPNMRGGYVAARDSVVLVVRSNRAIISTNNGETWGEDVTLFEAGEDTVTSIHASLHGLFVGLSDGELLHSSDTGHIWNRVNVPNTECPITCFADYRGGEVLLGTGCSALVMRIQDQQILAISEAYRVGTMGHPNVHAVAWLGSGSKFITATDAGMHYAGYLGAWGYASGSHRTVTAFAASTNGDTVYASTRTDGIVRTIEQQSWYGFNLDLGIVADYIGVVIVNDHVLTFTADSVFRLLKDSSPASSIEHEPQPQTEARYRAYIQEGRLIISGRTSLQDVESIRLYNTLGQNVGAIQQSDHSSTTEASVDVGNLPQGMYFVEIRSTDGVVGICRVSIW